MPDVFDIARVRTRSATSSYNGCMALSAKQIEQLSHSIPLWAKELGFADAGVAMPDPGEHVQHLLKWLARGDHGDMDWMSRSVELRARPGGLHPPTRRVIVCKMHYLRAEHEDAETDGKRATIARYALGRDYHKLIRQRLRKLARKIESEIAPHRYRVVCDSAPVMERALAVMAGLGWIGKNTMLLEKKAGSWSLIGALLTDLPLLVSSAQKREYCGSCSSCLDACPTGAFRGAYRLDARKCISYLTIEHRGAIPEALRKKMGNRIFGCDECQRVCPWNREYHPTREQDFHPRHNLDNSELCELFAWSAEQYDQRTRGMAIRRCGYLGWLRNIAVALGNAPSDLRVISALKSRSEHPSPLVREHVRWALAQHRHESSAGRAQTALCVPGASKKC